MRMASQYKATPGTKQPTWLRSMPTSTSETAAAE